MIKVLANAVREFDRGEEKVKTSIGFCELPNWVGEHPYFEMCKKEGSIRSFESVDSPKLEEMVKDQERAEALKREIAELEEKREATVTKGTDKINALKEEIAELEAQKKELAGGKKEDKK
jgi:hypothetical protein